MARAGHDDLGREMLVPLRGISPIDIQDFGEILDRVHCGALLVDEQGSSRS
jgi:hypothetical protein